MLEYFHMYLDIYILSKSRCDKSIGEVLHLQNRSAGPHTIMKVIFHVHQILMHTNKHRNISKIKLTMLEGRKLSSL